MLVKGANMIRTNSVTLTSLPAAIAYRRKGTAGGSAIVIVRADEPQPGIATISKTSGEPIIATNTPADVYPAEAFAEAMTLTAGMPYRKQGKPAAPGLMPTEAEPEPEPEPEEEPEAIVIDTAEYQALLDAFTDKNGKFSYALLNKELIQLAHRSVMVSGMLGDGASEQEIFDYVVGTRFRDITGNKDLTDAQVAAMAALIDEIDIKGAFKEFKRDIRSMQSEAKRA